MVLCAIIVAGLGVLNDVTITQASAVWELADQGQSQRQLFSRAMRIGRDHIASTVYTIAFATAGAALSVLLLISIYERPLLEVVQTEQFSQEIIRTLIGSIGLVLAVPLTTAVGVAVVRASRSGSGAGLPRIGTIPAPQSRPVRNVPPAERPDPEAATARTRPGRPIPPSRDEEPDLGPPEAETGVLPATKWRDFAERPSTPPTTPAKSTAPAKPAPRADVPGARGVSPRE